MLRTVGPKRTLTDALRRCSGTVLKLGTKVHHDALLAGIDRLRPTGCFALTELGTAPTTRPLRPEAAAIAYPPLSEPVAVHCRLPPGPRLQTLKTYPWKVNEAFLLLTG